MADVYPNDKIPFPEEGPITDIDYSDTYLQFSIVNNLVESDVLDDSSGNRNLGFVMSDYKPQFNQKTLKMLADR